MSTRDHSTIEELLAVRALGGLDQHDGQVLDRELAAHGDCEDCRRLSVEFTEVVGRLGLSLDPLAVDPGMADRIIASASDAPPVLEVARSVEPAERRSGGGRRWVLAVAAAAAFVLVVGGLAAVMSDQTTTVSIASQQQVVRFAPTPGTQGTLAMAYTPGQAGVLLWGRGLEDPGTGKVYEVWAIANGTPVSAGCVRPTNGHLVQFSKTDIGDADQMAVTVEPASCPGAPTTTPIMTAALTT